MQQAVSVQLHTQSLHLDFGITSRIRKSPINVALRIYGDHRKWGYTSTQQAFAMYELGGTLALKGGYKALSYEVSATAKRVYEQTHEVRQELLDLALQLHYKWHKWTASVTGKSLFHLNGKQWVFEKLYPSYHYRQTYRSLPGYLMLGIRYTF